MRALELPLARMVRLWPALHCPRDLAEEAELFRPIFGDWGVGVGVGRGRCQRGEEGRGWGCVDLSGFEDESYRRMSQAFEENTKPDSNKTA